MISIKKAKVQARKLTRREALALGSGAVLSVAFAGVQADNSTLEADYIIVGAGSAGCVLARRLTESGASVLLLEAGDIDDAPEIHNPLAWPSLLGSANDWQYKTTRQDATLNRTHAWARGKVVGGSGSINAMAHHRGHSSVYDSWQKEFGALGWSYQDLLPYFRKTETFVDGASELHGGDGPIYIDVPKGEQRHPIARQFIQASVACGYSATDDINGLNMEGPTWNHVAIKDGKRQSPAVCYLRPALESSNPPAMLTKAFVKRLLFEGTRCIGAEYEHNGQVNTAYAGREVLLCAGAIGSPKLLMLSGIGDKSELEQHDIKMLVALPGVGNNLQDHLLGAGVVYESSQTVPVSNYQHGEAMQYLKSDFTLAGPDILLMCVSIPFASSTLPPPPQNAYSILPCIMQPQSVGRIRLASNNPMDAPIIDPNYFGHGNDIAVMRHGFDVAREIAGHNELREWSSREVYPGKYWQNQQSSDEFIRQAANTFFHPIGTCAMGDRAESVVDSSLKVHGAQNLRVIDASVIPRIPSAPTHAPVLAMAELAADRIIAERVPL